MKRANYYDGANGRRNPKSPKVRYVGRLHRELHAAYAALCDREGSRCATCVTAALVAGLRGAAAEETPEHPLTGCYLPRRARGARSGGPMMTIYLAAEDAEVLERLAARSPGGVCGAMTSLLLWHLERCGGIDAASGALRAADGGGQMMREDCFLQGDVIE